MKNILFFLFLFLSINIYSYDDKIYTSSNYVNDYANILTEKEVNDLTKYIKRI